MQTIIGAIIILLGVVFAGWMGVWVCAIGGIIQFIEGVKATPVEAFDVAVGLVRFLGTGIVFWLSFIIPFSIGGALINGDK
tara:strand:- start:26874 stop:27116 length:243 start_codon:yes stop_codon:yes gene_type:complete